MAAGSNIKISISLEGDPKPSVTWYKDGLPLKVCNIIIDIFSVAYYFGSYVEMPVFLKKENVDVDGAVL